VVMLFAHFRTCFSLPLLLLMSDTSLFYTVISQMSVKINYKFLNLVWHNNSFLRGKSQKQEVNTPIISLLGH
jgi:hypothetical protein